jgi:hypothetical protein
MFFLLFNSPLPLGAVRLGAIAFMKLHKVKKRTAACDELSRVEPQNIPPRRIESSSGGQVSKDGIASLTLFIKIDRSTQKLTTGRIP